MHKAGDFGLGGPEVFDGVVCAVVAELELVGVCAESDREELMAEADAEDGQGAEEVPYGIDCVFDGCGCVRSPPDGWRASPSAETRGPARRTRQTNGGQAADKQRG